MMRSFGQPPRVATSVSRLGRAVETQGPLHFQAKRSLSFDRLSEVGSIGSEPSGKLGDANLPRFRLRKLAKAGGPGEPVGPFGA